MNEKDLIIQDLRRENAKLRAELERKQEEIELARRSSGASIHKCGSGWAYRACLIWECLTMHICPSRGRRLTMDDIVFIEVSV